MSERTATIFDIQRNSFVDGPGVRTTVFFKGCNLRCAWCHNPESHASEPQLMFYQSKCTDCGKCRIIDPYSAEFFCPNDAKTLCGKEYTVAEVLKEILKDKRFYDVSGGGVTFSGGECMLQIDFLEEILKACKKHDVHTAIDTAGNVPYERFERILFYTDIFLYDVKCYDSDIHRKYTGVSNELILSNLNRLLKMNKAVWIRIPIIPGVNDSEEEMQRIKAFLYSCRYPEKIELIPYHAMGEYKYAAFGKEAQIFSVPSEEKMTQLKNIFL